MTVKEVTQSNDFFFLSPIDIILTESHQSKIYIYIYKDLWGQRPRPLFLSHNFEIEMKTSSLKK